YIPENFNPENHTYVEPFLGGGALYFDLLPVNSFINDIDKDLVNFYKAVKNQNIKFLDYLETILEDWIYIEELSDINFSLYLEQLDKTEIESNGKNLVQLIRLGELVSNNFDYTKFNIVQGDDPDKYNHLKEFMVESIVRKWKLTRKIEKSHSTIFDEKNHRDYFETAIKSAYYTYIRDLYNQAIIDNKYNIERTSHFFFIREFCFGSMFRFNARQLYNIPYGGINYNRKNFARKVRNLQEPGLIKLLDNSEINNLDFYSFLKKNMNKLDRNSFVFLDPPYDTEFSDYSKNSFQKKDHERLEGMISSIQDKDIKFLLIIKETDFIKALYPNSKYSVSSFNKSYTYNMRGRNKRATSHLLISNK
ncbi:MAG: hypothetical protein GPJ54_15265, partial [Candidatus Heimdallarchaeota archaeon]|nr:hypothetical protein [Candidatus Heimdallarchaeota archaeon]